MIFYTKKQLSHYLIIVKELHIHNKNCDITKLETHSRLLFRIFFNTIRIVVGWRVY